ncbi:MGMT family protein [Cryobacterium sp. SO1]|uniref:MGMT family protein n=1 Tax=Cryobacterium sp. SO1 TaxID=1897061 RepID=UPI001022BD67|nr:MGMT family protein [Cryobacterium sp. SO1]RZI35651.1 DNA base-flipping protein [Cryobacterium sp. SO1]
MRLSPESSFVAAVLNIVDAIPPGRVMTYGDVAATLGSRAARVVGQTMAQFGADAPWWRVIRAGGLPPIGHETRALAHYRAEKTPLILGADPETDYRVDLSRARWRP